MCFSHSIQEENNRMKDNLEKEREDTTKIITAIESLNLSIQEENNRKKERDLEKKRAAEFQANFLIELLNQMGKAENDKKKEVLERKQDALQAKRNASDRSHIIEYLLDQFRTVPKNPDWTTLSVSVATDKYHITKEAVDFFCEMLRDKGLTTKVHISHVDSVEMVRTWTFNIYIDMHPKAKL